MLVSMVFQALYVLVDLFWVGRLGTDAVAAVGTLVAVVVGVIWISFYFVDRDAYLRFHCSDWKPEFRVWRQMLKIGLPAGVEFGLMGVYMVVVYAISRRFGAAAQAGFGVGFRIVQSVFLPIVALGFAVAPVAGQNFGAKQGDRVRAVFKTAASIAAAFMLPVVVLSGRPEFALTWIWWFTVVSTTLQMALNLVLLQREFRIKLA